MTRSYPAILLISAFFIGASAQAGSIAKITASSLNCRSTPRSSSSNNGAFSRGGTVTILSHRGNWYQVVCPNGKVGYIYNRYVSMKPAARQASAVPLPQPRPSRSSDIAPLSSAASVPQAADSSPTSPMVTSDNSDILTHLKPVDGFHKVRPTNYHTDKFVDQGTSRRCRTVPVSESNGHVVARLCAKDYRKLTLEGSGIIQTDNGSITVDYTNHGHFEVDHRCKYGTGSARFAVGTSLGKHALCLIPYKSLACDPRYYKPGTVIYIPAMDGRTYINESGQYQRHDGRFICADTGGAIKGIGRFDFFSGTSAFKGGFTSLEDIHTGDLQYTVLNDSNNPQTVAAIKALTQASLTGNDVPSIQVAATSSQATQ